MTSALSRLDIRASAEARRSTRSDPWSLRIVRSGSAEDLSRIFLAPKPEDPKAPLARIRDAHHMLARLMAEDKPVVEISAITGYAPARIRTLQDDPAMRELVAHYSEVKVFAEADIKAQVQHVALAAKDVLLERLETEPDSFSNKDLTTLLQAGLDRIGHGPSSSHNVNLNDPSKVIERLGALMSQEKGRIIPRDSIEATFTVIPDDTLAQSAET